MPKARITKISNSQKFVKDFAKKNNWRDFPNIDKFDHLHEELIEMSKQLRYKSEKEMVEHIKNNIDHFEDGIGDMFFGLCRLANQLGIDIERSFDLVKDRIVKKYAGKKTEDKHKA